MSDSFARDPSLAEKGVHVAGGALGNGAEIVTAFASQGARVGFVDLESDARAALCAAHSGVTQDMCDLRDIEGLRAAFSSLRARIGSAEVLVNTAARDHWQSWTEMTPV